MTEKRECVGRVNGEGRYGSFNRRYCDKNATLEHDGKWYCKLHHPPTVKAKSAARMEAYRDRVRAEVSAVREKREAAAEVQRKAAAYNRLVAWLDSLEAVGVAGRFIAPREVREVLEGK